MPSYLFKTGSTFFSTSTPGDFTVRFYDYDGTLLKSQVVISGSDATAPSIPSHDGLTFSAWSNTFTNVQQNIDVGATYATSDGKTHAKVRITTVTGLSTTLYLNKSDGSTLSVDWGDGTSDTFTNTGNFNTGAHTYAETGDYAVKLWISSGSGTYGFGNGSSTTSFCGGSTQTLRDQLVSVFIGSSVTSIETYAFYQCYALASVVIPIGVTSIGTYAFYQCLALASVVIPSGVTSIGTYAFYQCFALASVVIPSSVTSIGTYAFAYCRALASVVIPSGVASIEAYAFYQCYSLASVVIPIGVTSIGTYAFYQCYALASVVIPIGVTSIGTYAFAYGFALAYVVIPSSVASIEAYAFAYCRALSVYQFLPTTPPTLSIDVFISITASSKIYVPDASVATYKAATNWITWADYIYPISEMP